MPEIKKVKLVNRGPAGKLSKDGGLVNRGAAGLIAKQPTQSPAENGRPPKGPADRIRCAGEVVEIASLRLDPLNARLHPERNMQAIEDSLNLYGQCSPITVRRKGRVVMKGNGTVQAMINLGWTKVACSLVDFEEVEALGYGLADNRSAEHARWDHEVVAKIDRLMQEAGRNHQVGWSLEELIVLRMNEQGAAPVLQGDDWRELWRGMPEFVQEDQTAFRSVTVNFKCQEDLQRFLKLTGQNPSEIVNNSMWFPPVPFDRVMVAYRGTGPEDDG